MTTYTERLNAMNTQAEKLDPVLQVAGFFAKIHLDVILNDVPYEESEEARLDMHYFQQDLDSGTEVTFEHVRGRYAWLLQNFQPLMGPAAVMAGLAPEDGEFAIRVATLKCFGTPDEKLSMAYEKVWGD
jgi:hypothetical protein